MIRGATFSQPNMRAVLTRIWDESKPIGIFVGANPGLADDKRDDATARKYVGFGQRWGWGGYLAFNLFQWVATDMHELISRIRNGLPVNPSNPDEWMGDLELNTVVCFAWGRTPPEIRGEWSKRVTAYLAISGPTVCAARNKDGSPAHLSRLPYIDRPEVWA